MKTEHVETDVLCIGGGIGGLMAAIRARDLGANVIVAEKGNTLRSGRGGGGCDHFLCYIPEVHGNDMGAYIQEMLQTQQAHNFQNLGMKRIQTHIAKTFDIVRLWDEWGIPMRYNSEYHFAGHAFPGGFRCLLKYEGGNQKPVLTKEALKRGVRIINRVTVFDLVSNGRVLGAVGLDTREEKLWTFGAKSVILATGVMSRLYPGPTPGWFGNNALRISLTGDGRSIAYRAGAEVQDVETRKLHVGPRYFARSGQASWIGVYRDPQGNPVGPFVTRSEKLYGDITPEVDKAIFQKYLRAGKGPVVMDGTDMSEEDHQYMMHWLSHEGNAALLNHMKEEGIDYRKHPIEFITYDQGSQGRIVIDESCETTVKGLYAIGDEVAQGVSNASVFGWLCGETAANLAKGMDKPGEFKLSEPLQEKLALLNRIRTRKTGSPWKEANIALQQIMSDFAGEIRSEEILKAGMFHLGRLKEKALGTMIAANNHELGRAVEVMNLLDFAELVFTAALDRQETRGTHVRVDYPLANPRMNNKMHIVRQAGDKPEMLWREIRK